MAYERVNWENLPSTKTPVNADNLNKMDERIANAVEKSDLINLVYPVGSIYMSVNSTNPATLFGGTWVQLKDRFLLGAGDTYTLGNTGGEKEHQLTIDEMASHSHITSTTYQAGDWTSYVAMGRNPSGTSIGTISTNSAGGDQPHNNMPPYLVVNMWKRIA